MSIIVLISFGVVIGYLVYDYVHCNSEVMKKALELFN